jgi:N-acetylglucosamine kinase-like BadF-type ATPase
MRRIADDLAALGLAADRIAVGLTGFGPSASDHLRALLSGILGTAPERIDAMDDMALAYLGRYAPGEGHLISAGTGSFGIHIARDGARVRVGGRGTLIDDGGSGAWIALQALDRIYRAEDASGSFAAVAGLADEIFTDVGGRDWEAVRQFVYGGDRGRIGTLALAVARAASNEDETAIAILQQAGRELARLAHALLQRVGALPLTFVGGVLSLHPAIQREVSLSLNGEQVEFAQSDLAAAAARIAAQKHLATFPGSH